MWENGCINGEYEIYGKNAVKGVKKANRRSYK